MQTRGVLGDCVCVLSSESQSKGTIDQMTSFMMVFVLFQLIFLNKIKSTTCRDLSPNRPFQELNNNLNWLTITKETFTLSKR